MNAKKLAEAMHKFSNEYERTTGIVSPLKRFMQLSPAHRAKYFHVAERLLEEFGPTFKEEEQCFVSADAPANES